MTTYAKSLDKFYNDLVKVMRIKKAPPVYQTIELFNTAFNSN